MTSLDMRRIWPSRLHPTPDQIQAGHTIILRYGDRTTITGVGWSHADGTTVCSTIDDDGTPGLIRWQPTEARWTRQPWAGIASQADR